MRNATMCLLTVALFLVPAAEPRVLGQVKDAVQPRDDNPEVLGAVTSMALHAKEAIDKSQEALADIERLRSRKSLPLQGAFPSAEAAFLLGAPSLAIAIAERAVREYPTEKVPGVRFSVGIVGNLWIGTFARYGGDVTRAEAAYREVLSQLKTRSDVELPSMLASICYLYLAEIENHVRNRPEKAAALLNELRLLPSPKEKQAAGIHTVYKQWGEHMTTSLDVSRAGNPAASERAQPPYGDPTFIPTLHAALVGLGDLGDLNSLLGAARSRSNTDFYQCSLEKATGCKVSPIDIALAQFLLGNFHERKGNLATARRYYEELFEGDSFFAPDGGLALARCWQKESKTKEARATVQEVARRFPAYKDYAATLLQGWSTKPKNE